MLDAVLSARKRREVADSKVVFRDKLPSQVSEKGLAALFFQARIYPTLLAFTSKK
jgi:hypothetical protein